MESILTICLMVVMVIWVGTDVLFPFFYKKRDDSNWLTYRVASNLLSIIAMFFIMMILTAGWEQFIAILLYVCEIYYLNQSVTKLIEFREAKEKELKEKIHQEKQFLMD